MWCWQIGSIVPYKQMRALYMSRITNEAQVLIHKRNLNKIQYRAFLARGTGGAGWGNARETKKGCFGNEAIY
jgi:hypothetical protein